MSFETYKWRINTVGELKELLGKLPKDASLACPSEVGQEWRVPVAYFDNRSIVYIRGDRPVKAKNHRETDTVGELIDWLSQVPAEAKAKIWDDQARKWGRAYLSFCADWFDAWHQGDKVKMTRDGHEFWISTVDLTGWNDCEEARADDWIYSLPYEEKP